MELPDVSQLTPLEVSTNSLRSENVKVTYVNIYTRYETVIGYWDDIVKCFRYASNDEIITPNYEDIVRFEPIIK